MLLRIQGHEEAQCLKRRKVFIDALKQLDAQGLFGTGAARESALVNIMWGDQDVCAHVASARELNHTACYVGYATYVLPSLHAWAEEMEGSQSMYKEEALARIHRTITEVEIDLGKALGG